jgi:hypothetical protein
VDPVPADVVVIDAGFAPLSAAARLSAAGRAATATASAGLTEGTVRPGLAAASCLTPDCTAARTSTSPHGANAPDMGGRR